MSKYDVVGDDWERPDHKNYRLMCCDCGLVHKMQFRVVNGHVEFKIDRDNRATGQARRHMRRRGEIP